MNDNNGEPHPPKIARRRVLGGLALGAIGLGFGAYNLSRVPAALIDGRPRARPIDGSSTFPRAVDIVIVGGGFVGTSAALVLAERGVPAVLCEKGVIAGEASGRSMGYVDSQMLDPAKMELVARSKSIWRGLNARTGRETGYRQTGLVDALNSADEEAGCQAWLDLVRGSAGTDGRIVRRSELTNLFPGLVDPPAASLYTPGDGSAEPTLAAPAIAEAARDRGATILQQCAVRGIETRGGRITGVVTERGSIACKAVILAGGAWSAAFARSLDVPIPQLDVFLSLMGLSKVEGPTVPLSAAGYGFRPQIDGGYTLGVVDFAAPLELSTLRNFSQLRPAIEAFWPMAHVGFSPATVWHEFMTPTKWQLDAVSPFEMHRILVPAFREGPLADALATLRAHFPAFQPSKVRERWSGIITSFPDNMPVISAVTQYPGLYIGTGFTYGLTMGPAAGEALADIATGGTAQFDLHRYRLKRFADGSPLTFHG